MNTEGSSGNSSEKSKYFHGNPFDNIFFSACARVDGQAIVSGTERAEPAVDL